MESSRAFGSQATPYTDTTLYLRWAFQNKLYNLQKVLIFISVFLVSLLSIVQFF